MDNLLNSPGLPIGISLAVLFVTVWSLALYLTRRKGGIVVKTRQLQTEEHGHQACFAPPFGCVFFSRPQ